MASNSLEGLGDDFFKHILAVPEAVCGNSRKVRGDDVGSMLMVLQLWVEGL